MKVTIYIEGGGPGPKADARFRESWSTFFGRSGLKKPPAIRRGKGRRETHDDYANHLRNRPTSGLALLLVDSEDLVAPGKSVWQHLKERKDDSLAKPAGAAQDDAFLMICCMETWFLADRKALAAFFGQGFNEKAIPAWAKLEEVPKRDVLDALDRSTKACGPRQYAKGELSFDLLAQIDPNQVEQQCPSAKNLLDRLRTLLS